MTVYFDTLPKASFGGAEFPIESVSIVGGLRDHVHEYPHSAGGAPEKMGRKLYTIRIRAVFQTKFKLYPGLYPGTLNYLRKQFEDQSTADLVVPTLGTISCYCRNWTQEMEWRIRNGEKADFEFVEDLAQDFLVQDLTGPAPLSLAMTSTLAAALDALNPPASDRSIFDSILTGAAAIFAVADQTALFGNLLEAKVLGLNAIIEQADRLGSTQSAAGASVANALHDLWASTRRLLNDLQGKQTGGLSTYVTPITMSVGQISTALFGDSSQAVSLMQLNALVDPFNVPANTIIHYYPA